MFKKCFIFVNQKSKKKNNKTFSKLKTVVHLPAARRILLNKQNTPLQMLHTYFQSTQEMAIYFISSYQALKHTNV